jgi:site-specific DNA-methyltransferase (adenine-specific)
MPLGLARQALKATLPAGGVCLDPFMGLGTSGHAALELGGRFVGIDLHQRYLDAFAAVFPSAVDPVLASA